MKLTFEQNYFVIAGMFSSPGDDWVPVEGSRKFKTQSLRAAAVFRSYADFEAEKIFSTTFNESIEFPKRRLPSFLDPHQRVGVDWILTRKRSYLAHAPGAGKTAQAICATGLLPGPGAAVFIVPPSLTTNWVREVWRFADKYSWPTVTVIPTSAKRDQVDWSADFIIVPDSMLTKSWVYERLLKLKIKILAVDEASRFKESTAARTLALFGGNRGGTDGGYHYKGLTRRASRVVLLDGSPMPNRPMELWAPVYALDPEAIECKEQLEFGYKYCGPTTNKFGQVEFKHSSNETELKLKLQRRFMHVVAESELSHPERRRSMLFMPDDVRTVEHKTWERRHLSDISFEDLDEDASQGRLAFFRRELGIRKAPFISRYVQERLDSKNESILLFVWHREVAFELEKRLAKYKPGLIIGGVSNDDRDKAIQKFQSGASRLIIANIQAAGRGHNLQKADRVIFGEFSWTDELNKQCEKRASRRGRDVENFVRCEYIVAPNSMDEPMLSSIFTKEQRVRRIIG